MASIQKTEKGYRAFLFVKGHRETKQFATKREATVWAALREEELRSESAQPLKDKHTLGDAMRRYAEEVSPTKRGHHWEKVRTEAMLRDPSFPSRVKLRELSPSHLADWRDSRVKVVQAGTVLREISLISGVIECARREWEWIDSNPMKNIRKPRSPDHREVTITPQQVRKMLDAMGYHPDRPVRTVAQSVAVCFLTALRTGMRAGELTGLTWDRVYEDHCHLPITKTKPRRVPLTRKALRLINKMRDYDPTLVFGLNSRSLDANFRKYRERAGREGFVFHDCRHTAATMLAKKVDVLTLCRIFGWTQTSQALTYFNPSVSDIADQLNLRA